MFHFKKSILIMIALGIILISVFNYSGSVSGNISMKENVSGEFCNYNISSSDYVSISFISYGYSATASIYNPFFQENVKNTSAYIVQDFALLKRVSNGSYVPVSQIYLNMTGISICSTELNLTPGSYKLEMSMIFDFTNISKLVYFTKESNLHSYVVLRLGFPAVLFYLSAFDVSGLMLLIAMAYVWHRRDLKHDIFK